MYPYLTRLALLLSLCLLGSARAATDIEGVHFESAVKLAERQLALNGAGLRTQAIFKVYAIALYLPARTDSTEHAMAPGQGPKRLEIAPLMDVTTAQLQDALIRRLHKNLTGEEQASLQAHIDQFNTQIVATGGAQAGSRIDIDWLPALGTRLSVNGTAMGAAIPDERFYSALMRIWLGQRPTAHALKSALLGQKQKNGDADASP